LTEIKADWAPCFWGGRKGGGGGGGGEKVSLPIKGWERKYAVIVREQL